MRTLDLVVFVLAFTVWGCNPAETYLYVEEREGLDLLGSFKIEETTAVIKAFSDSAAYADAYQKFSISKRVTAEMMDAYEHQIPIAKRFQIRDADGNDVTYKLSAASREKIESQIDERVSKQKLGIKERVEERQISQLEERRNTLKVDSSEVQRLSPNFNEKIDEFDPEGKAWHKPKKAPKYTNRNGIYFYFQSVKDVPSNFRFRLQYHADDWLFIKKVQFSIDGKAYEFVPSNTETDSGNGGRIWEWFDERMSTPSELEIVHALADAKTARMKLIGSQYHKVKDISATEILSMRQARDLYLAMGGDL